MGASKGCSAEVRWGHVRARASAYVPAMIRAAMESSASLSRTDWHEKRMDTVRTLRDIHSFDCSYHNCASTSSSSPLIPVAFEMT